MRDHIRGWARRVVAGLSAAGLLVIGLQLAAATPAQAECYEWGCNIEETLDEPIEFFWGPYLPEPYGGYVEPISPGGSGDIGQTRVFQLDDEVVAAVNDVLKGDCASLLTNVNPPVHNPKTVFSQAPVVKSSTPNPETPDALASVPTSAVGTGQGTITLYPPFDTTKPDQIFNFIPAHNGLTRLPTENELKAMAVLHEIGHLTGSLGEHTQSGSNEYNLLILEKCFGINRIPV